MEGVVRAKRKPNIPVVLSRQEIDQVLGKMKDPYNLVVKLLYWCGLRLSECMKLRVHCFDFDCLVLTVHDGKGKKGRMVPLPRVIIEESIGPYVSSQFCQPPAGRQPGHPDHSGTAGAQQCQNHHDLYPHHCVNNRERGQESAGSVVRSQLMPF